MKKILFCIFISVISISLFSQQDLFNSGKMQCTGGVCSMPCQSKESIKSDPTMVEKLDSIFQPLQENPQYYGDRRFRKLLRPFETKKLKAYKPNFGKKIWVKSWELKDIKKKIKLFGKRINKKKYYISALEIAEDVSPFLEKELKKSDIDFKTWARKIEEFGRTYVNPDNAGKKKCHVGVYDYQNGNFLVIKATKPFNKKMVYYIGEDYDVIIKALLRYETRKERKSK